MTHLLKSEVEHQDLQSQIALLSAKFDEMSSFLGMKKSSSTSTSTSRYLTPQQAKASSSAIDDATTPQAPISSMKSPSSPNGRVFPTSYVNPYESYFSEDVPPPPPVDESEDENHNNTSSVDHWIEYSKRIGEQEASQAFAAMQMVSSSTQRVSSSYLPGSAQQAAQELLEHEQQFQNIAFTGTSPTDLLFAPTALAGSGLNSVADKKTPPLDYMSAADMASRTYDMYAAKFSEQRPSVSEGEEEDEDRITDSYDAMIERLSYKFATTVKPTQPSQIKMTMTSPELVSKGKIPLKQLGKEEQGTIVIPNSDIPTPLQAPLHPFIARITADDYSQQHFQSDVFDTSKQLFPHSPQRRIYDASLGSY